MNHGTVCPNCGAENSLRQEVRVEFTTHRPVETKLRDGKVVVQYGWTAASDGDEEVTEAGDIECSQCKETWDDEKELIEGKKCEYRCDCCDWWGFNSWQHGIERPDCTGTVAEADLGRVPA